VHDTKLDTLLHYISRGWALVPLHDVSRGYCSCRAGDRCGGSAGKHPRFPGWQEVGQLVSDAAKLASLHALHREWNWGVATGPVSGIWVLDVDPASGGELAFLALLRELGEAGELMPETLTLGPTGGGGRHLVFALPPGVEIHGSQTRNRYGLLPGLDVRGMGGQIVVAPSVSSKGAYGGVLVDVPPAVVGPVLTARLTRGDAGRPVGTELRIPAPVAPLSVGVANGGSAGGGLTGVRHRMYASAAIDALIAELAGAPVGTRNDTAFRTACRLVELINAEWAVSCGAVLPAEVHARWWNAGAAHPFGERVPDGELDGIWRRAEHRVAGAAAAPPSDDGWHGVGGEVIPFWSGSTVNGSANGGAPAPPAGGMGTAVDPRAFPSGLVDNPRVDGAAAGGVDPFSDPSRHVAPPTGTISDAPVAIEPPKSSWWPVDLSLVLSGQRERIKPELGHRQDGVALLYRGKEHSIASEPECGKTWWCALQVVDVLRAGGRVLFVDFEDDEWTIVGERLLRIGAPGAAIGDPAGRFRYVRPDAPYSPGELEALMMFGDRPADLVVLDGVTEGMQVFGLDPLKQPDAAQWRKIMVRPALNLGVATLATDHVVKDREARQRFAIGAQHKLAGLTGVQFLMEQIDPFGRGLKGRSRVLVSKDRNGGLRQHGNPIDIPGVTHIGDLVGDATSGDMTSLVFWAPMNDEEKEAAIDTKIKRLARLALIEIRQAGRDLSVTDVRSRVQGRASDIGAALAYLEDHKLIEVSVLGRGRSFQYVAWPDGWLQPEPSS
jgi:hypothetical protein